MARTVQTDAGPIRDVPDSVTDEEVQAKVAARQQANQVGNPTQQIRQQLAKQTGPIQTALIAASQFLANRRVPGFDKIPPGIDEALREESPVSSFIGDVAFPVIAGAAGGASVIGQGAIQGGLEAVREGTDVVQTGIAAGLGAAGAAGGNIVSRALGKPPASGIQPSLGQRLQSEGNKLGAGIMRRVEAVLQSFGGLDDLALANQKVFNQAVAKSFGQNADNLSPQVLAEAQEQIGGMFQKLVPKKLKLDTRSLVDEYELLFADMGTKARSIFGKNPPPVMNGTQYNNFRQALSQKASQLARTDASKADDIVEFITQMDNVVTPQVGPGAKAGLRVAREMYKNLKLVESMPQVVKTGDVAKNQLTQRMVRGYKTSFIQDTQKVLPETQGMFDIVREVNKLNPVIGDSGTALRSLGSSDPMQALGALLVSPTLGKATAIAGRPAVGGAVGPVLGTQAGAVGFEGGRQLLEEEDKGGRLVKPAGPGR